MHLNQHLLSLASLPQIKAYRTDDGATPKIHSPPASPEEVQPAPTESAAEDDELSSAPPAKKAKVDDDAEASLPEKDIQPPADEV